MSFIFNYSSLQMFTFWILSMILQRVKKKTTSKMSSAMHLAEQDLVRWYLAN